MRLIHRFHFQKWHDLVFSSLKCNGFENHVFICLLFTLTVCLIFLFYRYLKTIGLTKWILYLHLYNYSHISTYLSQYNDQARVRLIHRCGLYTDFKNISTHFWGVRLIHRCGLYTGNYGMFFPYAKGKLNRWRGYGDRGRTNSWILQVHIRILHFFKEFKFLQFSRKIKINPALHSSNICSFHMQREN